MVANNPRKPSAASSSKNSGVSSKNQPARAPTSSTVPLAVAKKRSDDAANQKRRKQQLIAAAIQEMKKSDSITVNATPIEEMEIDELEENYGSLLLPISDTTDAASGPVEIKQESVLEPAAQITNLHHGKGPEKIDDGIIIKDEPDIDSAFGRLIFDPNIKRKGFVITVDAPDGEILGYFQKGYALFVLIERKAESGNGTIHRLEKASEYGKTHKDRDEFENNVCAASKRRLAPSSPPTECKLTSIMGVAFWDVAGAGPECIKPCGSAEKLAYKEAHAGKIFRLPQTYVLCGWSDGVTTWETRTDYRKRFTSKEARAVAQQCLGGSKVTEAREFYADYALYHASQLFESDFNSADGEEENDEEEDEEEDYMAE